MKYKIFLFILLIFAAAGFYFRNDIASLYLQLTQNLSQFERISVNSVLNKINTPISLPPPLRIEEQAPESFLTKGGTIKSTNAQRVAANLPPLVENQKLDAAALAKAQDMLRQQYFAHTSPSGVGASDLAKNAGYEYLAIGENLAMGNFKDDEALVLAWMNSPGHRANILNSRYTEIGVATIKGTFENQTTWMAVQEFGLPSDACPQPDQKTKTAIDSYNTQLEQWSQILQAKKSELENHQELTREEYTQKLNIYNELVGQYNALITQLKTLINQYNKQVDLFNECVS
jgi:uncharacterized protein YkwD